jgi:N-acetylglucosaminyldiphosphoundecaprenol N-acetyl-beta-D-mannosaminyltransferase
VVEDELMTPKVVRALTDEDLSNEARLTLFGLSLSRTHSLENALEQIDLPFKSNQSQARLVTFVNPRSISVAKSDARYRADLRRMKLVFSDGIALTLAARWFGGFPMQRISFDSTSLAPRVLEYVRAQGLSVALVGGQPSVAEIAANRLRAVYPGISIVSAVDGYRPQDALVNHVRALSPQVVVCGMGAPRQEAFLTALVNSGWTGIGFTCGGYLDHLSERFHYYPAFVNRFNLRWLYRLAREPRRIGYRYLFEYGPFWRLLARGLVVTALQKAWRQR